jgi:hypothetical protein
VIGGQDDGRRLQQSASPQEGVDLAQALVDAGHRRVVAARTREMDVEEVDEGEERPVLVVCQPAQERRGHGRRGPLELGRGADGLDRGREGLVEGVESLGDSELGGQHVGPDERGRTVPAALQDVGESGLVLAQLVARVLAHSVVQRKLAGQHGDVSGKRQRVFREGVREEKPFRRPSVEVRSLVSRVTVAAQPVGPERVDADQDQVGCAPRGPQPPDRQREQRQPDPERPGSEDASRGRAFPRRAGGVPSRPTPSSRLLGRHATGNSPPHAGGLLVNGGPGASSRDGQATRAG